MALIDEMVKSWLKQKFLDSSSYHPETQGSPDYIKVVSVDSAWECNCYSEYTRGDTFVMTARIAGSNGREFDWRYGVWGDLPSFIDEIDGFLDASDCPFQED